MEMLNYCREFESEANRGSTLLNLTTASSMSARRSAVSKNRGARSGQTYAERAQSATLCQLEKPKIASAGCDPHHGWNGCFSMQCTVTV